MKRITVNTTETEDGGVGAYSTESPLFFVVGKTRAKALGLASRAVLATNRIVGEEAYRIVAIKHGDMK